MQDGGTNMMECQETQDVDKEEREVRGIHEVKLNLRDEASGKGPENTEESKGNGR